MNRLFGWAMQLGRHEMFRHRDRITKRYCEKEPNVNERLRHIPGSAPQPSWRPQEAVIRRMRVDEAGSRLVNAAKESATVGGSHRRGHRTV